MSSRQQEGSGFRQAPKLPQFPARKPATPFGQSPVRRNRVDSLPGVPATGRSSRRLEPARWGRTTGAEKLLLLGKRSDAAAAKDDSLGDEGGGVDGFESPQLVKARAQVARDEVLSYMHHRRYQRKGMGEGAADEPRDTFFGDSDIDDDSSGDRDRDGCHTQLLQRVQRSLERCPLGRQPAARSAAAASSCAADDDLRPTSADQSPTRHARSYPQANSGGSLAAAAVPSAADSAGALTADTSTGFSRAGPGLGGSTAHQGQGRSQSQTVEGGGGSSGISDLSEDAFDIFRREVAARVIQTHWRRWQDWKTKVRREAEERVLQQLLSDGSGLSLKMLLSGSSGSAGGGPGVSESTGGGGGGSDRGGGGSGSTATSSREQTTDSSLVLPTFTLVPPRPATALVPLQQGRPTQPSRYAGGRGGAAGSDRPAPELRPTSAAAAALTTLRGRGLSPARSRVTAPTAAASPSRSGRKGSGEPLSAHGDSGVGVGRALSFASGDALSHEGEPRSGADGSGARKASAQPYRKHTGGHAVYTFVATPHKHSSASVAAQAATTTDTAAAAPHHTTTTAAPGDADASVPQRREHQHQLPVRGLDLSTRPSQASAPAQPPAATTVRPSPSPCPPLSSQQQLQQQQRQPSLDADTNPAMASPALSTAGTDRSSGDNVLGPASPVASMATSSSKAGSQPSAAGTASASAGTVRPLEPQPNWTQLPPPPPQQQQPASGNGHQQQLSGARGTMAPQGSGAATNGPAEQQVQKHRRASAPEGAPEQQEQLLELLASEPSLPRTARAEALQRLKLQGGMRGGSAGSAGFAAARNDLSGAALLTAPKTQAILDGAAAMGEHQRAAKLAVAEETQAGQSRYVEPRAPTGREPRHQRQTPQQPLRDMQSQGPWRFPEPEHDEQGPCQPPPSIETQDQPSELSEEASLRALQEPAPAPPAAIQRRHHAPPGPRRSFDDDDDNEEHEEEGEEDAATDGGQEGDKEDAAGARAPPGWAEDARHPCPDSSPSQPRERKAHGCRDGRQHQQGQAPHDAASTPLVSGNTSRGSDLRPAHPGPPGDRATPQLATGGHRSGPSPANASGRAHVVRPLSAPAAEQAARQLAAATAADLMPPPGRVTLAGDEGSLVLFAAGHAQPREATTQQQTQQVQRADRTPIHHHHQQQVVTAWSDRPPATRTGVGDFLPHLCVRDRSATAGPTVQQAGDGVAPASRDAAAAGPVPRAVRRELCSGAGFGASSKGSNSHPGPAVERADGGGSSPDAGVREPTALADRLATPCSARPKGNNADAVLRRGGKTGSGGGGNNSGGDAGRGGAAGGGGGTVPRVAAVVVDASVTAEKMSSILKYLDQVEMQAEQEATCAALVPVLLTAEPASAATVAAAAAPLLSGLAHAAPRNNNNHAAHQHSRRVGSGGGGGAVVGVGGLGVGVTPGTVRGRRYDTASATSTGTRQMTTTGTSSRPGTARTTASLAGPQAALSDVDTVPRRSSCRSRSLSGRRRLRAADNESDLCVLEDGGERDEEDDAEGVDEGGVTVHGAEDEEGPEMEEEEEEQGDAVSLATRSMAGGLATRPAFLAESVYENVRAKIRRLQDDVQQRDARIAELTREVEDLQAAQRSSLMEADARLSELLAAQRAEYEGAVSRHLAFVDRLLADKEALTGRAQQLAEHIQSADERQERAIAKLKEGWAAELRRQKEGWAAAERARREAWMASKAAEIKDVTVKGLEGEVQKLLARHRSELSAAQQAAAEEARRHLDTYVAQNEAAVRQLKERLVREAEEAVEKERAAAATRLREVSERYEQQLQTQRMRLVADADLRLEQLEQARKEDKKRFEEALAAAREASEGRLKEAEEDWRREKDAVRRAHEKQMDALREQYETGQEGWRAAMAERARKEVSERVAAIRDKLMGERNEDVQAVLTRLESEHAAAVEALKEDFRRREEAAAARSAAALKEARRGEAKMAERFRSAGLATKAAEERLAAAELAVSDLRRELEAKNNTIRWMEAQVSTAKDEAAARERDVRSLGAEKAAVAAEVAAAVARDKQQVEARLAAVLQEAQELRARHSTEMAAVEARVRATLARKDEVIAGLREQLAAAAAELRSTQEVLRQQEEELTGGGAVGLGVEVGGMDGGLGSGGGGRGGGRGGNGGGGGVAGMGGGGREVYAGEVFGGGGRRCGRY